MATAERVGSQARNNSSMRVGDKGPRSSGAPRLEGKSEQRGREAALHRHTGAGKANGCTNTRGNQWSTVCSWRATQRGGGFICAVSCVSIRLSPNPAPNSSRDRGFPSTVQAIQRASHKCAQVNSISAITGQLISSLKGIQGISDCSRKGLVQVGHRSKCVCVLAYTRMRAHTHLSLSLIYINFNQISKS